MSNCPLWAHVIVVTLQYTLLVVSDGLLIWRCFHVWGCSLRSVAVPIAFLLVETGISLAIIGNVPAALLGGPIALLMDRVQSAALFVSFLTTTLTTALIGYRIYTLSQQGNNLSTAKRVKHVTKILVESSTIYCIVLLVNAVVAVIPSASYLAESPVNISSFYVQIVLYVVSGMAPTIVVARIALANPVNGRKETLTTDLSGISFEERYISSQLEPKTNGEGTRADTSSVSE
ncbi:hypothetical protein JR316_0010318 [Psilocybe cubensis]|uniref:Uncharacterized protein n=2 Tax=Psilocybe cubensis TaxID=181762 RepID=A0A8H8CGQ3_PSICU|nr:hypothetical protein JR316_0010318 [Psilocybe cubensis]KAH9478081.1 hypothetical protein JR316_0010318 [Psilocybe cubensis]